MPCSRTFIHLLGPLLLAAPVVAAGCGSEVAGGKGTASQSSSGGEGAGTSGSGGSGSTTTSGMTTAASGAAGGYPECIDRDPEAVFEMEFDLAEWDPEMTPEFFQVELETACELSKLTRSGSAVSLELSCEHEERGATPIAATLTVPSDLELPMRSGTRVALAYKGHGTQGELQPGAAFVLRSAEDGGLMVAGYDISAAEMVNQPWIGLLSPLSTKPDDGSCPRIPLPQPNTYSQRRGLAFSELESALSVLDGRRAVFDAPSGTHDIVVARASGEYVVYQDFYYRFIVVRRG